MRSLSSQDILDIWEHSHRLHHIDRAIRTLAAAMPEVPAKELAHFSIGKRDTLLFRIMATNVGHEIRGVATCSQCHERLEYTFNLREAGLLEKQADNGGEHEWSAKGFELRFRLPNSLDMAAIVNSENAAEARKAILTRCILDARKGKKELSIEDLPDTVVEALAQHMLELDPNSEIKIDLNCPACGNQWSEQLDIMRFLWAEIRSRAERLLMEVHTLAWAYGWCEKDILALSAARRQMYLAMVV